SFPAGNDMKKQVLFFFPNQCTGTQNGGIRFFQMADKDFYLILKHLNQIRFHSLISRLKDKVARLCETSKKDDGFGTGEHDKVCQCQSEDIPCKLEDFPGNFISFHRSFIYVLAFESVFRNFSQKAWLITSP